MSNYVDYFNRTVVRKKGLILLLLLDHALNGLGTHLKNGILTNCFRIGWKSAYCDPTVDSILIVSLHLVRIVNDTRIIMAEY